MDNVAFREAVECAKEDLTISQMADIICGEMSAAQVRELIRELDHFMPEEV